MKRFILFWAIIFHAGIVTPSSINNLFNLQRKSSDYISFLNGLKFTGDINSTINKTLLELNKINIHLAIQPNDSIRYATYNIQLNERNNLFHLINNDRSIWLDVKFCQSKEVLDSTWQKLKARRWGYTGLNFQDSKIGFTPGEGANAVIAIIKSKNVVFNIGLNLPIKSTSKGFEKLSDKEQKLIMKETSTLGEMIKIIAENFVSDEDRYLVPVTDRELNESERLLGFFKFWNEVKYNFAFFDHANGLNWDKILVQYLPLIQKKQTTMEYYKTLRRMCALLNDGHTGVHFPDYVERQFDRPKIELKNFQNKAYVVNIAESLKDKINIGSEIIEVNNSPIKEYLEENIFPYYSTSTQYIKWDWGIRDLFKGIRDSKITAKIKNSDQSVRTIELVRNESFYGNGWLNNKSNNWRPFEFKWLEDSLAYVALNEFEHDFVVAGFEKIVPELVKAKGIIIDLRDNNGGSTNIANKIIEYLTDKPFLTSKWKTREMRSAYRAWGKFYSDLSNSEIDLLGNEEKRIAAESILTYNDNNWYQGSPDTIKPKIGKKLTQPIVVLIGHVTASAAEDFLISMDYLHRATFVGDNSFGSTGQPFMFNMPGGGSAQVCTKRDFYPDGREFVGFGVKPDIFVQQTINDLLNNYDKVLEKGKEVLKSKL